MGGERKTMNKNFSFEFTKTESGWLDFEIHIQNATFHYFFSDDISTQPEELILWLEKIYNKDYCEFECETEDFFVWFDYDGKEFRLYDQINLLGKFEENRIHKYLHGVVEISRIDLCTIIYKAFRTFVTSKKYRKVYWQKVSFEETLVDGYGSLEKALDFASTKTLSDFYDDYIEKTGYDRYFTTFTIFREFETTEELDFPLSSSFDSLDSEGKKSMILKYATHIEGYNGNELHKIQPEVLENLLKANTQN